MTLVHLDFETYSEVNIKKCGNYRYADDPSTEILCLAYAVDDEDPVLWTPDEDDSDIRYLLRQKGFRFVAHNATFEKNILDYVARKHHRWPTPRWEQLIDTAAIAAYRGYPRSLDGCAKALGLIEQKDPRGSRLISKLCTPRKPSKHNPATRWTPQTAPQDFSDLYDYCLQDVRTEREIHNVLGDLPDSEQEVWLLDARMNRRGMRINQPALRGAMKASSEITDRLTQRICRDKPFDTLGQRDKILGWCEVNGYPMRGYAASDLEDALSDPACPPVVRELIAARQQTSRTSIKKFDAMDRTLCSDGTIKGGFLYYGAHTGRWAGRLIQGQNLFRPTIEDYQIDIALQLMEANVPGEVFEVLYTDAMEAIISCLRGLIIPSDGYKFYCADYSNVEGRVLFCAAGEEKGLDVFRLKRDLYKVMAEELYKIPYDAIDYEQRRMGKLAILGLGYQMGPPKFIRTAAEKKVFITEDFAGHVVDTYREEFDQVPKLWYAVEEAARQALTNPGRSYTAGPVKYMKKGSALVCRLPSGRFLFYPNCTIRKMKAPWGGTKDTICYMAEEKKRWVVTKTFGGKLVENIVQAICRDLLVVAHAKVEAKGYQVRMTVHDELVTERKDGTGSKDELIEIMTDIPQWAKGWPIEASGWEGYRFKK